MHTAGTTTTSHTSQSAISTTDHGVEIYADSFRAAMRELALGVAVITVGKDNDITGFTATSVSSLTADPPRLLVSVAEASGSWRMLQRYPYFGVNILRDQERALANRFAGRDGLEGACQVCRRSIDDPADGHAPAGPRSGVS